MRLDLSRQHLHICEKIAYYNSALLLYCIVKHLSTYEGHLRRIHCTRCLFSLIVVVKKPFPDNGCDRCRELGISCMNMNCVSNI